MAMREVDELYARHIKRLSLRQRIQLLQRLTSDLEQQVAEQLPSAVHPVRSIMELHGLGKEMWGETTEAQTYVNQLRGEWEHRS
jgi:hypothetical protein